MREVTAADERNSAGRRAFSYRQTIRCLRQSTANSVHPVVPTNATSPTTEGVQSVGASMLESAFWEREKRQSTALGRGVALPHVTLPGLSRSYVDLWMLDRGIDFKDAANTIVDVCFVVVAPEGERRDHLRILARIGHLVLRPEFMVALRRAENEEEVRTLVDEHEQSL